MTTSKSFCIFTLFSVFNAEKQRVKITGSAFRLPNKGENSTAPISLKSLLQTGWTVCDSGWTVCENIHINDKEI